MKIHNMIKTFAIRKYRKSFSIALASLLLASSFPINGGTALATPTPATLAAAAGSNFVFVITGNQSFGDEPLFGVFKGQFATYTFTLPSNTSGKGHVMLQASHVDTSCNRFEINGTQIAVLNARGGSSELRVEMNDIPSGVLKPGQNTLFIRSLNSSCGVTGNLDDFRITNVVVTYQTQ